MSQSSMSDEKTVKVEDFILSKRPDGSRILSVNNAGKRKMEFRFSAEQWQKLGEDAGWFQKNADKETE